MSLLRKKSNLLFVLFTKNNIICTLTTLTGKPLNWTTAGSFRFRGTKKITTSSVSSIIKSLYNYNKNKKYYFVHVKLKGTNKVKTFFIKYLKTVGFNVVSLKDDLILPHNGCRKARNRRI